MPVAWPSGRRAGHVCTCGEKAMMPSNHLILCHPLLLLPSIFPSTRVFSNKSVLCIRWPKYWSFSFIISPSHEYPGLISFRVDQFDLTVQGALNSLLQHQNHQFFGAQPQLDLTSIHDFWRKHSLTIQTFVGKLMSLLDTTLEPQLENTHETPQSTRDEGLLLLYGLESNPESSIQTPQEA